MKAKLILLNLNDRWIYKFKPLNVISVEDLVIAKLKWIQEIFSDRQFNDIENLIMGNELDMKYLNYWINELKLKTFNLFANE